MKSDFHFHTYSRITVIIIFILPIFLIYQSVQTKANEYTNIKIGGWGWSNITGWVSLNCLNDYDGDGELDNSCSGGAGAWGLEVNSSEAGSPSIKGCGWGGNDLGGGNTLGYICFSDQNDPVEAPQYGVHIVDTEQMPNVLCPGEAQDGCDSNNNYADIVNLNTLGDTNMYFPITTDSSDGPGPVSSCFNCHEEKQCNSGGSCIEHSDCDPENGDYCNVVDTKCDNCLEYSYFDVPGQFCSEDHSTPCTDDNDCIDKGECVYYRKGDLDWVKSGFQCVDCNIGEINNTCDLNAYGTNLNNCDNCTSSWYTPGVILDNNHNRMTVDDRGVLCGWGWNAWEENDNTYGLGWFQFSPRITPEFNPYFSVEQGSIYGLSNIFSTYAPPYGGYNASYLIEAGGSITNLVSSSTISGIFQGEQSNRPEIDFLTISEVNKKLENVLGKLDIFGLKTGFESEYNKYGSKLVEYTNSIELINNLSNVLEGNVFYKIASSDITINQEIIIQIGNNNVASGIVFIPGDLNINSNITYSSGSIDSLKEIPSLVWIVMGDVNIDPSVTDIAGTFIVLGGEDGEGNSITCPNGNCGQFNTGSTGDAGTEVKLIVRGNVLAKQFNLQRQYYDSDNPSIPAEQFVNDGRLQANPPPGLLDFSKAIPRFNMNP